MAGQVMRELAWQPPGGRAIEADWAGTGTGGGMPVGRPKEGFGAEAGEKWWPLPPMRGTGCDVLSLCPFAQMKGKRRPGKKQQGGEN